MASFSALLHSRSCGQTCVLRRSQQSLVALRYKHQSQPARPFSRSTSVMVRSNRTVIATKFLLHSSKMTSTCMPHLHTDCRPLSLILQSLSNAPPDVNVVVLWYGLGCGSTPVHVLSYAHAVHPVSYRCNPPDGHVQAPQPAAAEEESTVAVSRRTALLLLLSLPVAAQAQASMGKSGASAKASCAHAC